MTTSSSPGATAWSLLLAFLGGIVTVYLVEVAPAATTESPFDPFISLVVFPMLGAIVAVPTCVIITLAVWGCLVLGNRWVRTAQVWADVVSVALVGVVCSALSVLIVLILPTLRESLQLLAYSLAVVVIVTICLLRRVGRHELEPTPAPSTSDPSA